VNLLLAAAYVLIWGSAFNAARIVVLEWPALWSLAIRFTLTLPLVWLVWRALRAPWPEPRDRWRVLFMGGVGVGVYLSLSWAASAFIPAGLVSLLAATAPLFVALGEAALGRRLAALGWLGLAFGWIGVCLLGGARALDGLAEAEGLGIALALTGAMVQALGLLVYAPARGRVDAWTATLMQTAAAALVTLLLVLAMAIPPPQEASPAVIGGMAYSILLVGMAGYALFFVVIGRFGAARAAALQLLAPPVAVLIGSAGFGERLYATDLIGGAVTLLGLFLLFRTRPA
jgi:drug/metabolite transporter (DMT)-like permease